MKCSGRHPQMGFCWMIFGRSYGRNCRRCRLLWHLLFFEQVQPELTEEQQAENEKSVLDDLEMFG